MATIWIVSGEGEQGAREEYTGAATVRALKARLAREAAGGDRWARCEVETDTKEARQCSPEDAIAAVERGAAAAALGKRGGAATSAAKAAAAKANGAKGGRPPSDATIAERTGAEHARQAFAAGVPATEHEGQIDEASWDDLCERLGRKIYGYGDEGRELAKAYVRGWDSVVEA